MLTTSVERDRLIQRYADGPGRLEAAPAGVPEAARQWRPAPGEWSVHETICHCAHSEANAAPRIRDQAGWAERLDYGCHPLAPALAVVEAVRANTVPLLRLLPADAWGRAGRHTESGRYTAGDWLRIYAAHLEDHARQIEAKLTAWQALPRG